MDESDQRPMFITDEEIIRRLEQLDGHLADFEAKIPAMRREISVLREHVVPARAT